MNTVFPIPTHSIDGPTICYVCFITPCHCKTHTAAKTTQIIPLQLLLYCTKNKVRYLLSLIHVIRPHQSNQPASIICSVPTKRQRKHQSWAETEIPSAAPPALFLPLPKQHKAQRTGKPAPYWHMSRYARPRFMAAQQ